ncbi:hypothetical protein ACJMK2_007276 [Sinanodonta woodiana]|uniref:Uncharacterized protein n=1 Tax=Sinanodonta woodiana TaxID=1069815 RepID=A0ABD3VI22_SINWO
MISGFDSHSRDTSGLSSPDGTVIVATYPNMRHLLKFIRDLTLSLIPVSIMVQRTDSIFLGFIDSKIYPNTTSITKDLDTEVSDENILLTDMKPNALDYDYDDDSYDDVPLAQFDGIASINLESSISEYTLRQSLNY